MLFVASKICPYTHWTKHYLILALKETCFNYEIKDRDTNEQVFELAHFGTRLQYPMEWHFVQLAYSDLAGTTYCLQKKIKFILIETFTVLTSSCNVLCYWQTAVLRKVVG